MALNAGDDVVRVLWRVWYLLDGADAHAMAGYKLLERAKNPTWRDPVATFEIERHGDPAGQIQTWNVNLARGTAECVDERPLRPQTSQLQQDEGALAAELASLIRAGEDDPRLRWADDRRHEVKVLADSALGGATSSQAKRLREAIAAELGDAWVRERGLFVRAAPDPGRE